MDIVQVRWVCLIWKGNAMIQAQNVSCQANFIKATIWWHFVHKQQTLIAHKDTHTEIKCKSLFSLTMFSEQCLANDDLTI